MCTWRTSVRPGDPVADFQFDFLFLLNSLGFYWSSFSSLKLHRRLLAPFCHEYNVSIGVFPSCKGKRNKETLNVPFLVLALQTGWTQHMFSLNKQIIQHNNFLRKAEVLSTSVYFNYAQRHKERFLSEVLRGFIWNISSGGTQTRKSVSVPELMTRLIRPPAAETHIRNAGR